jgi:hypothetical protein
VAGRTRWLWRCERTSRSARRLLSRPWTRATSGCQPCAAVWSNGSLDWAPARILRPLRAPLKAQGGEPFPGGQAGPLGAQPPPRVLEPLPPPTFTIDHPGAASGGGITPHHPRADTRRAWCSGRAVRPSRRRAVMSCTCRAIGSTCFGAPHQPRSPYLLTPKPDPNPDPNLRGLRNGNFTDAAVFSSFTNDLWVAAAPN